MKKYTIIKIQENKLNLNFIFWFIGFVDAEGSFQIVLEKHNFVRSENKNYKVKYGFQIGLNIIDKEILESIQTFFNKWPMINSVI